MGGPEGFKVIFASSIQEDTFNAEIEYDGEFFAIVTTYDAQPERRLTIEFYPPEKRKTHKMDLVEIQDLLADLKYRSKAYGQNPGLDRDHPFRDGNVDHLKHLETVNTYLGVAIEALEKKLTEAYDELEVLERENGILQFQRNRQKG